MTIRQSLFIIEYQKPGRWDELKISFIYFRIESLLSLDVDTINWGIIPMTITPNFYMQMDGISEICQKKILNPARRHNALLMKNPVFMYPASSFTLRGKDWQFH